MYLVGSVVAFVANADEGVGSDVGVADDALPVALLAQTTDRHARLLAAEDEVRVVLRHHDPTHQDAQRLKAQMKEDSVFWIL